MNGVTKGDVPSSLFMMPQLTYLRIITLNLDGTVPTNIGNATGLVYLELGNMYLTGTIPTEIGLLRELTVCF